MIRAGVERKSNTQLSLLGDWEPGRGESQRKKCLHRHLIIITKRPLEAHWLKSHCRFQWQLRYLGIFEGRTKTDKSFKCLSLMMGIGTKTLGVKGNQINFSSVNVCCKATKCYVNKFLHCFQCIKIYLRLSKCLFLTYEVWLQLILSKRLIYPGIHTFSYIYETRYVLYLMVLVLYWWPNIWQSLEPIRIV